MENSARVDGDSHAEAAAQRLGFLRWQCRVRQMLMRDRDGMPDESVMPDVILYGDDAERTNLGTIMTVLNRLPEHTMVPEMQHISRRTYDPAQRREGALKLLCSTYFQSAVHFSDVLTASFGADSLGAVKIARAKTVELKFEKYAQRVSLRCKVWRLSQKNPYWQATYWHNGLFNPGAPTDATVLAFEPDWSQSSAQPAFPV